MKCCKKENDLYFYFYDDLDYLKIHNIKQDIQKYLKQTNIKKIYFDFRYVTFIDSTGIGFVLARYRELTKQNVELVLCNLSKENKIIFEMSGIFRIIRYQENGV